MFKKKVNKTKRVDPELDGDVTTSKKEQRKVKVKAQNKKQKVKKKSNWFNWFVPFLLISTGFGFLVLYPKAEQNIASVEPESETALESVFTPVSPKKLSNELVSRYFNGTEEDRNEQLVALENTLQVLKDSTDSQAQKALSELRESNLNAAKKSLIGLASSQQSLQESSQTWISIGNVQNLSSSKQALQAYKKASEIDPENISAYSRQGHVYRQLKQFDLAEKAYKRVQSFGNQSTANQAATLANFGLLNVSKGKLAEAEDAFSQSLSIYKKIEDDIGIANVSFNLANIYKESGRLGQAETYYRTSLKTFTENDEFQKMANNHAALGGLYLTMKLFEKSQKQYETALEISNNNNFEEGKPDIYQNLGYLAEENEEEEKARVYFAKANGTDPDAVQDNKFADELGKQAIASRRNKEFIKAEELHKQAIKIYQNNKSIAGTISQQINLGFLYKVWDKIDLACLVWKDTLVISERANSNRTSRVQQLVDSSCN